MAFPSDAARTSGNDRSSTGTSHVVNLPAGIAAGDTLVVFFSHFAAATVSWPAGWTELFDIDNVAGNQAGLAAAWRKADGTEGSTITVTTSAGSKTAHTSYLVTGAADPTVSPPQSATATGSDASANPPNLAPSGGAKDYLWLVGAGQSNEAAFTAYPTNYVNGITDETGTTGATATNGDIASASRQLNAASEDPGVFTYGVASEWVAATIAITPSAVADAEVSAFEVEVPTPGDAEVSAFELEVPDPPGGAQVSVFELEVPDLAPGGAQVSAFELEVPTADADAEIAAFELEVPDPAPSAQVSAFELEVPDFGAVLNTMRRRRGPGWRSRIDDPGRLGGFGID